MIIAYIPVHATLRWYPPKDDDLPTQHHLIKLRRWEASQGGVRPEQTPTRGTSFPRAERIS